MTLRENEAMLADIGLLLLRIGVGGTLIAHGYPKLFGGPEKQAPDALVRIFGTNFPASVQRSGLEAFSANLERMGIPMPRQAAVASALAEFGGGVALMLGVKTRLIAPIVFFNMLVAIRKAHWKTGLVGQGGYELAFLFAVASAVLTLTGPGAYALDGGGMRRTAGEMNRQDANSAKNETG